jgi:hypothetical protein
MTDMDLKIIMRKLISIAAKAVECMVTDVLVAAGE